MRELEETVCEIRNVIELHVPLLDYIQNDANDDDESENIEEQKEEDYQYRTVGGFLDSSGKYSWLAYKTLLTVTNTRSGECISTWNFTDKISSVSPFPSKQGEIPLILVGLDNCSTKIKDSLGYLCVYDSSSSCILRTIQVPAGVEKACIVHGGTDWEDYNDRRPDNVLPDNSGLIFVSLRNLQHIVIDLDRESWGNSFQNRSLIADIEFPQDEHSSFSPKAKHDRPVHSAYNLLTKEIEKFIGFDREEFESSPLYNENLTSVLISCKKTGCMLSGCLGRIILWQSDGTVGWISPLFDENMYVTHIALLEPTDDPRPFYYLWVACQNDSDSAPVLRMFALLFEKKYPDKGVYYYYNLNHEPSLKFELELEEGEKIHSLFPIERDNSNHDLLTEYSGIKRGEDGLLLIGTNSRLLIFDLNRWYKEQMPRTITECRNPNSIMSCYSTEQENDELVAKRKNILSCLYEPSSLRDFPNKGPTSPEELFFPNSLGLGWIELNPDSLTFWITRGVQAELLREIVANGPIILMKPKDLYQRCLIAGLIPFDAAVDTYSYDSDKMTQQEMLLSLCLEQRWTSFLTRCAQEWSDGSASYLYSVFLKWGIQRATEIKLIADKLCVPLFDQSGNNIGESEIKTLRFCMQQLECLSTVISKLPNLENSEIVNQRRALKRVSTYLQVLLWFYDVGLLPETQDYNEDTLNILQISRKIPYPRDNLISLYENKRSQMRNDKDSLFIDKLIGEECVNLRNQWKREEMNSAKKNNGMYPPPSLQTLLRSFLVDCHDHGQHEYSDLEETETKHKITIYLLMDIAMQLQNSCSGVDQLIKYPSAFKLSPSLIKMTQAFWLLDHGDYEGFFDTITGQLISDSDIKIWQHKLIMQQLLINNQHKLAFLYLRIMKPPLNTFDDQNIVINLSVRHGLIQSAFQCRPPSHYSKILIKFFKACKLYGKLKDIMQLALDSEEEEAFLQFLEQEGGCEETRLLYYLQRCRHIEASDVFNLNTIGNNITSSRKSNIFVAQNKIQPLSLKMFEAYNATLPQITKKFASTLTKKALNKSNQVLDSRYPRPLSHYKNQGIKEIYDMTIKKTKETYVKPMKNFLPFLGAPCSSSINMTRNFSHTNIASDSGEIINAHCVLFPSKKVTNKRRLDQMQDEDNSSSKQKRIKLSDDSDKILEQTQSNLVCETPLIVKKSRPVINDMDIISETPHSILKMRQMLKRNSNSPVFGFSPSEKEALFRRSSVSEDKRIRQIRFSMDRKSGSGSTSSLLNEETNSTSSKAIEVSEEEEGEIHENENMNEESEQFYSPNVSFKSLRDNTVLVDSSFETSKKIKGPRPRRSLRKSSLVSRASSNDSQSDISSNNEISLNNQSLAFTPYKKEQNRINVSRTEKLTLVDTFYASTVLSSGTSMEETFDKSEVDEANVSESTTEGDESITEEVSLIGKESQETDNFDSGLAKESLEGMQTSSLKFMLKNQSTGISEEVNEMLSQLESSKDQIIKSADEGIIENDEASEDNSHVDKGNEIFKSLANSDGDIQVDDALSHTLHEDFAINKSLGIEQHNLEFEITDDEISQDVNEKRKEVSCKEYKEECDMTLHLSDEQSSSENDIKIGKNHKSNGSNVILDIEKHNVKWETEIADLTENKNNEDVSHIRTRLRKLSTSTRGSSRSRQSSICSVKSDEGIEVQSEPILRRSPRQIAKETSSLDLQTVKSNIRMQPTSASQSDNSVESLSEPDITDKYENARVDSNILEAISIKRDNSLASNAGSKSPKNKLKNISRESSPRITDNRMVTKSPKSSSPRNADKPAQFITLVATRSRIKSRSTTDDNQTHFNKEDLTENLDVKEKSEVFNSKYEVADNDTEIENVISKRTTRATARAKEKEKRKDMCEENNKEKLRRAVSVELDYLSKKDIEISQMEPRRTRASSMIKEHISVRNEVVEKLSKAKAISKSKTETIETTSNKSDEDMTEIEKPPRQTRGSSLAESLKGSEVKETKPLKVSRKTRAASVSKEAMSEIDHLKAVESSKQDSLKDIEVPIVRNTRKRGSSVPKDTISVLEESKSQRSRRSTSLIKDTIFEENTPSKKSRFDEINTSSPACNTRSRRSSSLLSIPGEFEEVLNVPSNSRSTLNKEVVIKRRATSVEPTWSSTPPKRVTRSTLTKTSIINETIPEESGDRVSTRASTRIKKNKDSKETSEVKQKIERPKRGKKVTN